MYDVHICDSHQQHLITVGAVGLFGVDVSNDTYAATLFLQRDGHFRRLLQAVDNVLESVRAIYGEDPASEF